MVAHYNQSFCYPSGVRNRTSLIVAFCAAASVIAATLGWANADFLPYDLSVLSDVSPSLIRVVSAFASFWAAFGLVSTLYSLRQVSVFTSDRKGYLRASFSLIWVGVWFCSVFIGSRLQDTRISAELEANGVVTEALVTERRVERRMRRRRRELRVYYRYSTPQGFVNESEWEREAQTGGRNLIRVRYSTRYPKVNRVEQ